MVSIIVNSGGKLSMMVFSRVSAKNISGSWLKMINGNRMNIYVNIVLYKMLSELLPARLDKNKNKGYTIKLINAKYF